VKLEGGPGGARAVCTPVSVDYTFRTARVVPRTGVMIVGWGGNNGTTVTAGCVCARARENLSARRF
jgi:myo-inositol-1-phosphate synthase